MVVGYLYFTTCKIKLWINITNGQKSDQCDKNKSQDYSNKNR